MTVSAGTKLGPYEILAPIGRGGMGEVWKARDTRLGRDVAIKISTEQFSERFEREARAVAALNHPNICTLFDVGPNYLVMEYIEGATLAERIKEGRIPLEEALRIARHVADAFDAAHEKNIIHRDLKPGNIKIKPDGTVKVLDFGLAKMGGTPAATNAEDSPTLTLAATQAGMILGTAAYMSPEQARGKEVDKRADIWAFGVVLYEMVTGKKLFEGNTTSDVLAAVLREDPDLDHTPAEVRSLLRRCLEKDPQRRLRDIGDAMALIDEVPTPVPPTTQRERLKWQWIVAGLAVLVVAVASSWILRPAPEQSMIQMEINPPEGVAFGPPRVNNQFALSPNGRYIVFQATGKGQTQMLWLRAIDSNSAVPLAGTENGILPFWSPDSRWVGFSSPGKLQKIDVMSGGQPQVICEIQGRAGGSWGSGGNILFDQLGKPLQRVSANGGSPSPVFSAEEARGGTGAPWFLPDGKHFLYRSLAGRSDILVGSLDGKEHRVLVEGGIVGTYAPGPSGKGAILYNVRGQLLVRPFDPEKREFTGQPIVIADSAAGARLWSASANGLIAFRHNYGPPHQLAWFGRDGRLLGTLGDPGLLSGPRISPDQGMIAVVRSNEENSDIWTFDLTRNNWTRFTFNPGRNYAPLWSPEGKSIVYVSSRATTVIVPNIVEKSTGGGGSEKILENRSDYSLIPGSISRDGRWLVFSEVSAVSSIILLRSREDPTKQVRVQDRQAERDPSISPDGRWLLYSSTPAARREVLVQAIPKEAGGSAGAAGGKWQVSTAGGNQPTWRADSKEIFFVAPDGMMMAAAVESSETFFRPGVPKPLFQTHVDTDPNVREYDVTPDGQRFVLNQRLPDTGESPITLIVNWPRLLEKRR